MREIGSPIIYGDQAELEVALEYWQDVLRLRDWRIKAEIVERRGMPTDEGVAGVSPCLENRSAHLVLLDPKDYGDSLWPQDHEQSLVHELLHIHTEPLMPDEYDRARDVANEQAIESIAWALVRLKRSAR